MKRVIFFCILLPLLLFACTPSEKKKDYNAYKAEIDSYFEQIKKESDAIIILNQKFQIQVKDKNNSALNVRQYQLDMLAQMDIVLGHYQDYMTYLEANRQELERAHLRPDLLLRSAKQASDLVEEQKQKVSQILADYYRIIASIKNESVNRNVKN